MDSLVADVVEDLHDTRDLYVLDLPMVDLAEDLHVSPIMDLKSNVVDMDFIFEDAMMACCNQLQRLLVKYYVQLITRSEYVDWVTKVQSILVFD